MSYAWILFDADGTLFDYDAAEAAALAASFARIGHAFLPEHSEIYRTINGRMWLELEKGTTTQERLRVERFKELFETIGVNNDPAQFSDNYTANLATQTELIDGADSTVAALAEKARLMLITNGLAQVQRPRFAASSIRRHFEGLVISEEVGAAKPDPQIFGVAFATMNHPRKSKVLMVGDSLTSDIKGGNDYGIDTCWFNPSGRAFQNGVEPTYEIRRIDELINIVLRGATSPSS
jgi:2-haloacid dehalogenase